MRAFTMPKWGIEMVEGTISEWSVKEGDPVVKGQTIVLIETDKVVNEVEAEFDTKFVRITASAGEVCRVGALLAVMAQDEVSRAEVDAFVQAFEKGQGPHSDVPAVEPIAVGGTAPEISSEKASATISPRASLLARRLGLDTTLVAGSGRRGRITYQDVMQASKPPRAIGGRPAVSVLPTTAAVEMFYASPAAARLAVAHGIDLRQIKGTGPRGRISRQDVAPPITVVPLSPMRKAIARRLTLSKTTVPHFYLRLDVNFDRLMTLRANRKQTSANLGGINDFLVRATALALVAVPDVNIQVHGDEIHRFANADIAIAVATDRGLVAPVLRAVETKSVPGIANELRALIARARAGSLRAPELEGGSFTISNLGMFGVDQFDAIINPPQGAILAIGTPRRVPVERGDSFVFSSMVTMSLSCDHRAIDGVVGSRFLTTLRQLIESPERL